MKAELDLNGLDGPFTGSGPAPIWRIDLFGGLRVNRGREVLDRFRSRTALRLLAYLAFYPGRHSRDRLAEILWPDASLDRARRSLSTDYSSLRHLLEPDGVGDGAVLILDSQRVGIQARAVSTDVSRLETALRAARLSTDPEMLLLIAAEQYRGPLLGGLDDGWALHERARLENLCYAALLELIDLAQARNDNQSAIRHAWAARILAPAREPAYRKLMQMHALRDEPTAVSQVYRDLERTLRTERLDGPSEQTLSLLSDLTLRPPAPRTRASAPTVHSV
ncbi:MAG TPA: BTAD domain-containing putative transcriptional regulator [Armatimonadota bacterium]|nr:BTAD domain-containing putative transcriptional regulator [Armatimonadota bacterium]